MCYEHLSPATVYNVNGTYLHAVFDIKRVSVRRKLYPELEVRDGISNVAQKSLYPFLVRYGLQWLDEETLCLDLVQILLNRCEPEKCMSSFHSTNHAAHRLTCSDRPSSTARIYVRPWC